MYRGLLSVRSDRQREGLGRLLVERTLAWVGEHAERAGEPLLTWGCIEARNDRSLRLLRARGAQPLGLLETLMVYRQWPRIRVGVDVIEDPRLPAVRGALDETHADCGLRSEADSPLPFLAVSDEAGIVAGARPALTRVDMERIGGLWDVLNDRLLRHVPAARRRFDPRNFTYVRLSDVVVRPGHAGVWRDFLSTVMAMHGTHMAMLVLDPRSRASGLLHEAGVFGRFAAATRQRLLVLGRAWNLEPARLAAHVDAPVGLGPLDL